ncbi:MAG: nitric oxide synthase oxygenase [Cyanobacteriota bacterium ELA615]
MFIKLAKNNGRIRPFITVFKPQESNQASIRI